MIKVQSYVMLILFNMTIKLSNMRKKIMVPPSATKVRSNMILILPNVTVEPIKCVKKIRDN